MLLLNLQKSSVKFSLRYVFFNNYSDKKGPDEKNEKTAVQKTELGRMKRIAGDEREYKMDDNLDQVILRPFIISM